jgi:hypothetical protein
VLSTLFERGVKNETQQERTVSIALVGTGRSPLSMDSAIGSRLFWDQANVKIHSEDARSGWLSVCTQKSGAVGDSLGAAWLEDAALAARLRLVVDANTHLDLAWAIALGLGHTEGAGAVDGEARVGEVIVIHDVEERS